MISKGGWRCASHFYEVYALTDPPPGAQKESYLNRSILLTLHLYGTSAHTCMRKHVHLDAGAGDTLLCETTLV